MQKTFLFIFISYSYCLFNIEILLKNQQKLFQKSIELANKSTLTQQEKLIREQLFLINLKRINQFNNNNVDVKLGVNQFSIMTQEERNAIKANKRKEFIQKIQTQRQKELQNEDENKQKIFNMLIDKILKKNFDLKFDSIQEYQEYWENIIRDFIEVIQDEFDYLKSQKIEECFSIDDAEQSKDCIDFSVDFLQDEIAKYRLKNIQIKNKMLFSYNTSNTEIQSVYYQLQQKLKTIFQNTYKIMLDSLYNFQTNQTQKEETQNNRSFLNPYNYINPWMGQKQIDIPEDSLFHKMKLAGKASKDWHKEGKVSSVKNQGQCGACWTFSAVATIESQLMIDRNSEFDLSEQQPLNCALEKYGKNIDACDGSMGHIAVNSIKETGIQLESDLPYIGEDKECRQLDFNDTRFDIQKYYFLKKSGNMQEFLETLYERPLAVALFISDVFLDYQQGNVDCLSKSFYEGYQNNHEVLAVGYHIDLKNPSNSYIKFKNQWSSSWGDDGYFKLKLYNEIGYLNDKKIVGRNSTSYQEKLYLYFGPCGILRSRKDTFWVKMKSQLNQQKIQTLKIYRVKYKKIILFKQYIF